MTIQEAARRLGVSEGSVRKRVKRGTLEHEKDEDGRVYVYLDAGMDEGIDEGLSPERDALISAKDETIAALRDQLEAERQAHAEARRLLMAALERIPPAIEAPREPSGGPQTTAEAAEGSEHPQANTGAQEGAQRSWWRRWLGGQWRSGTRRRT